MHSVLETVLDDDFVYTYKHGMIVECPDGKRRRIYPRILTYSADYPEKYISPLILF